MGPVIPELWWRLCCWSTVWNGDRQKYGEFAIVAAMLGVIVVEVELVVVISVVVVQ